MNQAQGKKHTSCGSTRDAAALQSSSIIIEQSSVWIREYGSARGYRAARQLPKPTHNAAIRRRLVYLPLHLFPFSKEAWSDMRDDYTKKLNKAAYRKDNRSPIARREERGGEHKPKRWARSLRGHSQSRTHFRTAARLRGQRPSFCTQFWRSPEKPGITLAISVDSHPLPVSSVHRSPSGASQDQSTSTSCYRTRWHPESYN